MDKLPSIYTRFPTVRKFLEDVEAELTEADHLIYQMVSALEMTVPDLTKEDTLLYVRQLIKTGEEYLWPDGRPHDPPKTDSVTS